MSDMIEQEVLLPELARRVVPEVEVVDVEVLDRREVGQLFGVPARVSRPFLGITDLQREWTKAFDAWLSAKKSERTRDAYQAAWNDLLDFFTVEDKTISYWEINHEHIRAWKLDLETRVLAPHIQKAHGRERGYSASTVNQYLAAISSFYSYAMRQWPIVFPDGSIVHLADMDARGIRVGSFVHPVKVIDRPTARGCEAYYMSIEQINHILNSIDQTTLFGVRDYALLNMYIVSGVRNSEIRMLRWKDFRERGGAMQFYWQGKGHGRDASKQEWIELPPDLWEPIMQYLKLSGRWATIEPDDYIFTAVTNRAQNLANVGESWHKFSKPLSGGEVNRIVRKYCRRANKFYDAKISVKEVHAHTLRHSYAVYLDNSGVPINEIRNALHHNNIATTQRYLHQLKGSQMKYAQMMLSDLRKLNKDNE